MASRRALSLSSSLFRHYSFHRIAPTASITSLSSLLSPSTQTPTIRTQTLHRCFHSTSFSLLSARPFNDGDKIDPDTILFEGCDYKHWLIVMDFPHDPQQRPPAEEMVETYVQTLAKVVGSVEEAKKKMYACSTTTYTGFQAEIDEETAQKFEGMPGVLFVLPDSYIDPVNKEYGGDKYINGTIIPRPPPVQYGRVRRGSRQNDQRMRGPMPNQYQGSPAYNQHQGDGKGYMPLQGVPQQQRFPPQDGQQGFPQQHGQQGFPPQQGQQGFPPQQGQQGFQPQQGQQFPPQQGQQGFPPQHGQQGFPPQQGQQLFPPQQGQRGFQPQEGQRGFQPQPGFPPQQGFSQQQGFPQQQGHPQQQRIPAQQTYGPPGQVQRGNPMAGGTYYPGGGRDGYPGSGGNNHMPSYPGNKNNEYSDSQGQMGVHARDQRGYAPQGQMGPGGASRNYNYPPPGAGAYGQTGSGTFDQGEAVQHGPGSSGSHIHGAGAGFRQGYGPDGQTQSSAGIPDVHGNTASGEHSSYTPTGHTGMNQGRN